jgi:periplasmic divalent cation tolerance protein
MASHFVSVTITCEDEHEARRLAEGLVQERLAACVHIMPVKSIYRWKEKIEAASELSLSAKTKRVLLPALEHYVKEHHSYNVPEIVATPLEWTSADYGRWLNENTRNL